jgi:serine protease Do
MYENNIHGNSDNDNPMTGNFSGARDMGYEREVAYRSPAVEQRPPVQNQKPEREEKKKLGLGQKIMLSISLGLFFGIFAGIGFYGVQQAVGAMQQKSTTIETTVEETAEVEGIPEETQQPIQQATSNVVYTSAENNVSGIVKEVMPAMVSIVNNYTEVSSFWGQTYKEEMSSSGSGIIVAENDDELLIVTNQHVVADAEQLLVTLIDDTEVEAKIKGTDADMDLAVIAISLDDLSSETRDAIAVATLGDSDSLVLGEQVIAIGNALGYGQSVTVGYISALDREIELEDGSERSFIQTDAAINPGNSGGALLNAAGEVIGINSNKIGGTSIEGMGYAIPITAASPIIADLMERQTRNKVDESEIGYIGITYQDVTDQIVSMYGMPKGVYVVSVAEGSGAEAAGIIKGDVITKFDGEKISSFSDLQDVLQYYAVGDTAKITVMRPENGEYVQREFTVTLGERPVTNRTKN